MAEPLYYSFEKGCDFAKKSCKEYIQLKRNALVLLVKTVYIFTPIVTLGIQYIQVRSNFVIVKILRITITITTNYCPSLQDWNSQQKSNVLGSDWWKRVTFQSATSRSWPNTYVMSHNSDFRQNFPMNIRDGHLRFHHLVTIHTQLCPVVYAHHVLETVSKSSCLLNISQDGSFLHQKL